MFTSASFRFCCSHIACRIHGILQVWTCLPNCVFCGAVGHRVKTDEHSLKIIRILLVFQYLDVSCHILSSILLQLRLWLPAKKQGNGFQLSGFWWPHRPGFKALRKALDCQCGNNRKWSSMFVPLNRVAHFMPIRLHKYGSIYVEGANCQEHRRRGAIWFVHCQVRPDVVNFNAAISALAVAGRASQAQELLQSMAPRRCQEGGPGQVKQQVTGLLAIHKFRWSPSSHLQALRNHNLPQRSNCFVRAPGCMAACSSFAPRDARARRDFDAVVSGRGLPSFSSS